MPKFSHLKPNLCTHTEYQLPIPVAHVLSNFTGSTNLSVRTYKIGLI